MAIILVIMGSTMELQRHDCFVVLLDTSFHNFLLRVEKLPNILTL